MIKFGYLAWLAVIATLLLNVPASRAQGQFSPELQVGTDIITRYQIDQRALFLTLLGAPGDARALAREQLINEALQLGAAEAEGITISEEAVEAGIAEFAGRANLTPEQFVEITQSRGVSNATVRDFFTAGVAWRETIRARFGESLRASVSDDDARRSLALSGTTGGLRVLVSEILLPATTPETTRASQERAAELGRLSGEEAFSAAARQFSVAPSAARGGALDWVALDSLPLEVRSTIDALSPGQVSRPIRLENAIGVFLLRDEERVAAGAPDSLSIEYALFTVAGGPTEAAVVAARVDVCDDFYGVAQGLPDDRLVRETKPAADLPGDLRAALADLDEGETSTALTRNGTATVLMLCQRAPSSVNTVDLTIAGNQLLNQRLGTTAQHYLALLRASSEVIDFRTN